MLKLVAFTCLPLSNCIAKQRRESRSVDESVVGLLVARAGEVGAGQVLRDGSQREGTAYAAVPGMERSW